MYNILQLADSWGDISDEQVIEFTETHRIFPCGKCSNEEFKVLHNVLGRHNHRQNYTVWKEKLKDN